MNRRLVVRVESIFQQSFSGPGIPGKIPPILRTSFVLIEDVLPMKTLGVRKNPPVGTMLTELDCDAGAIGSLWRR